MRKVAALLLFCVVVAPAASARQTLPGRVLSYSALGGPAQAGDRIAWFEPAGSRCGRLAVRDTHTLRRHDLGTHVCSDDGVPWAFTYGAGAAFWIDGYCGNECYQSTSLLAARGSYSGEEDIAYDDYDGGTGTRIDAVAGDASYLIDVKNTREVDPAWADSSCNYYGEPCPVVITSSQIEVRARLRGTRQLVAPWPVVGIALAGDSVALEQAETGTVQIRDMRSWRVESTIPTGTPGEILLSRHYLAVVTPDYATIYRRSDGTPMLVTEARPYGFELSDAGFVTTTDREIVVNRFDGRRLTIPTRHGYPVVSLSGRRLAWRDGHTIRLLTLPR